MLFGARLVWRNSVSQIFVYFLSGISIIASTFFDKLKNTLLLGRVFLVIGYPYQMTMAFFGQLSAQVPQPTHMSSSRTQVFAARSTVSAPAGHLRAQIVQ